MTDFAGVSITALRQRCDALAGDLIARGIEPVALEKHEPGGSENPAPEHVAAGAWRDHPDAWLYHYTQLVRRHALLGAADEGGGPDAGLLDDALAAAGAEEPVEVRLQSGEIQHVFPKSYHALRWLDALDRQLVGLADMVARLQAVTEELSAEDRLAYSTAPLVESTAVRLWLTVLAHEGPGLPWADSATTLEPAAWTANVTPADLLGFVEAHLQVNATNLAIIAKAFPPEGSKAESRLRISGFLNAMAQEQKRPARDLFRKTALGAVFAAAIAKGESDRSARAQAERESESKRRSAA